MYTCDCGKRFADLSGLQACARGNHGRPERINCQPLVDEIIETLHGNMQFYDANGNFGNNKVLGKVREVLERAFGCKPR
jgi:hypothetical protein